MGRRGLELHVTDASTSAGADLGVMVRANMMADSGLPKVSRAVEVDVMRGQRDCLRGL